MLPGTHEGDAAEINVGGLRNLSDFEQRKVGCRTFIRKQNLHVRLLPD